MHLSRRQFFARFSQSMVASVLPRRRRPDSATLPENRTVNRPARKWIRPPGALPEPQFHATCTRCTDCAEACPYDSIRRLGPEFGPAAGTPAIIPTESPCYLCEDMPCIAACEPKALVQLPVQDVNMGLAVLDPAGCYLSQGQPCDYCLTRCPLGAQAIALGPESIPLIDQKGCTGCGVCAYLCPADALTIIPAMMLKQGAVA